jgi:hypothetical protein
MNENNFTSIGLKRELKQELDELKLCPMESYGHIIRRLIDNNVQNKSNSD